MAAMNGGDTVAGPDARHARAAQAREARNRRDAVFAADARLFGDPAWDILVSLYARGGEPRRGSVEEPIAVHVAPTVAQRYLQLLVQCGLVVQAGEPAEPPTLSDKGRMLLDRCFGV